MKGTLSWKVAALGTAAVMAAACADSTAPLGDRELQVSVRVVNGPAAGSAATTVVVESATFVLGGLKLETAGLDNTIDWVFEKSVVIPLDLTGAPTLAFDTDVPPGIYKELEVSIDKLEIGNPAEQPLIDMWPMLADASVLVQGTVTRDRGSSEPFAFAAPLDVDLELLFDTPRAFTAEQNPVTVVSLTIDMSRWFAAMGDMLDPTDPANRSAIEGNIQASLEVYDDD